MIRVRNNDGPERAKPEEEVAAHALTNEPVEVTLPPDDEAGRRKYEAQRCHSRLRGTRHRIVEQMPKVQGDRSRCNSAI